LGIFLLGFLLKLIPHCFHVYHDISPMLSLYEPELIKISQSGSSLDPIVFNLFIWPNHKKTGKIL
jgi:hypothetical protein